MKKFIPYKDIRKRAMIFGLPLSYFALQMISVIGSFMVIIFSFSMGLIILVLLWNIIFYAFLSKLTQNSELFHLQKIFPLTISNKKLSPLYYEED